MHFFVEYETVRKIIVGILILGLVFFGGKLRGEGKTLKNPLLSKYGVTSQIISACNAVALLVTDYLINISGALPFTIALLVCLVADIVFLFIIIPKAKAAKNLETNKK